MKKFPLLIFFLALLFNLASLSAQQPDRCGTMSYLQLQEERYPGTMERWRLANEMAAKWLQNNSAETRTQYVIPVVVHVVWKTTSQNISDEQIQSQIDVLNEDFTRLNADTFKTPSPWKSVAGSMDVKFCLAAYDPQGNPTSGIERIMTTKTSFELGDSVKFTELGGADGWPPKDYLNIWVCNLTNSILGYATLPSNDPGPTDGVVILYKAFGRVGTLSPDYNKGRTCTHEVGHWLGLSHIWGDDGGSCSGSDNIADTPNQGDAVYNCATFPPFDDCTAEPNGIMFMNYMDYTDDDCMNLFTKNQCEVMSGILNTTRSSILTSPAGCQGVAYDLDAAISTVVYPVDTILSQFFEPQVQLSNRGALDITYVKITYQVDGQSPSVYEFNGLLTSQVSTLVPLQTYFTGEGGHILSAWTSEPNHSQDQFIYNDTASGEFLVISNVAKNTTTVNANPSADQITVTVLNPSAAMMEIEVVNMMGQVIQRANWSVIDNPSFIIDLSNASTGMYFLYGKIGYDYVKKKIMVLR